jgi:CBS domain-containing protein
MNMTHELLVDEAIRTLSAVVALQHPLVMARTASVKAACQRMAERGVGSVLVTDEAGALVGIFTGRDAVARVLAAGKAPGRTRLRTVMTPRPCTMTSHQNAVDALRLMWDGGFRHVPVVDDGKIRGVVSRGDFKANEQDRLELERALWEHMR